MRIADSEWDEGNAVHIELGHGIKAEEAEEVSIARPLFRKTKRGYYAAMGPTTDGRYSTIVFEMKQGAVARVITGWDMNRAEIRYWKTHCRIRLKHGGVPCE